MNSHIVRHQQTLVHATVSRYLSILEFSPQVLPDHPISIAFPHLVPKHHLSSLLLRLDAVLCGSVFLDLPNPVLVWPDAVATNALNREAIQAVNATIYSTIESTFNKENNGHADAGDADTSDGAALFLLLTQLNNGTKDHKLDDTRSTLHSV